MLSDDDFRLGSALTVYDVQLVRLNGDGGLRWRLNINIPTNAVGTKYLEVDGSTRLYLRDAQRSGGVYDWTSTGLVWAAGDSVTLKLDDDPAPPSHVGPSTVDREGKRLVLVFSETLDSAWPVTSQFTVEADASPVAATSYDADLSSNERLGLVLSPRIRQGQTVTVTYADPTSGNDARAVQDAAGNDAIGFAATVRNDSTYTGAPGGPTGLEARAMGPTRIDLSWTAPIDAGESAIEGYRIELSADGSSGWQVVDANTASTDPAWSDTLVDPASTRHYRVSAINAEGAGAPSDAARATTVAALPLISGAPRIGGTLNADTSAIRDPDGLSRAVYAYQWIRVDADGRSSPEPIAGAGAQSYVAVADDVGKRLRVKVTFTDDGGNPEERISAAFPAQGTVIANTPATGTLGIGGSGRAGETLNVIRSGPFDANGLTLLGSSAILRWVRIGDDGTIGTAAESRSPFYMPVAADVGSRIRVEMRFTDDAGFAERLTSASVAIRAAMPPATCPAPRLAGRSQVLAGTVTVDAIRIGLDRTVGHGFAAEAAPGLTRGGRLDDTDFVIGTHSHTVLAAFASTARRLILYLDRELAQADAAGLVLEVCGETYAFADAAHDDGSPNYTWVTAGLDWSSVRSRMLVLSTASPGVPDAPTRLMASAVGKTRIDLSWTAPGDVGDSRIAGYRIEWSADGRSDWRDLIANTGSTVAAYSDTGLAAAMIRHYRVSAINGQGTGSPSAAAHAVTATLEPGQVTGLMATATGARRIELAWDAPAHVGDSPITGYRIEFSPDGRDGWEEAEADTGSTERTYSEAGLRSGSTWHYRVSAINSHGMGPASDVAFATTDDIISPVLVSAQVLADRHGNQS